MNKRYHHRFSSLSLLALLACWATTTSASSQSYAAEHDRCTKGSCRAHEPATERADFVFGRSAEVRQDLARQDLPKPTFTGKDRKHDAVAWGKHDAGKQSGQKDRPVDNGHPGFKPEVIHTADGTDVLACPIEPGFPPTPATTAVPVPAAFWLFLSGVLGLGLSARRRTPR